MLRTVFLPAANADALRLKVESLQAQLAEHKQLSMERIEALKQDKQLRAQVCVALERLQGLLGHASCIL